MTGIIIKDLERNEQLEMDAMTSIRGGNGLWAWGWIRPYSRSSGGAGGANLYNPVFNIQVANQTINGGDGPITAINAPISAPSTTLTENISFTSIKNDVLNQIASGGT